MTWRQDGGHSDVTDDQSQLSQTLYGNRTLVQIQTCSLFQGSVGVPGFPGLDGIPVRSPASSTSLLL